MPSRLAMTAVTAALLAGVSTVAAQTVDDVVRRYLDARMDVFGKLSDPAASSEALARSVSLQNEIWALATAACRDATAAVGSGF